MKRERSRGAVVFTRRGGRLLYVVVHEETGRYSLPKGHMEGDETEEQTARREIFEETGLRPAFLPGFREEEEYTLENKPGTRKQVVYFLAEFGDEPVTPRDGEINEILLLPYEKALPYLRHEGTRRILSAAHALLTGK